MDYKTCFGVDWSCMDEDEYNALVDSDPDLIAMAENLAAMTLRRLSGYQVGNCPITVRPCVGSCMDAQVAPRGSVFPLWSPYIRDGRWYNSCGCTPRGCSCTELTEIVLGGPVGRVDTVVVDGVTLVEGTDYRVDNGNVLVRLAGPEWPTCQDMTADPTTVGSGAMAVTYVKGAVADTTAERVAGILAKEYLDACRGNDCRLPASVTSLTRQGVSMDFSSQSFPEGLTNIPEVDAWIKFWNPYLKRVPAQVFSPDRAAERTVL